MGPSASRNPDFIPALNNTRPCHFELFQRVIDELGGTFEAAGDGVAKGGGLR